MRSGQGGDDARATRRSRREVLGDVGGLALGVGVAGCGEVTSYEFRADRVGLPTDARTGLGYDEERRTSIVTEESREVGDTSVEATIESHLAVYESTARSDASPPLPTVAILSTPRADIGGQALNPLARGDFETMLAGDRASRFLRAAGFTDDGAEFGVAWERKPELVDSRSGTCLGEDVAVETHAGLVDATRRSVAVVYGARADADSVVLTGAVQRRPAGDEDGAFVGPDGAISAAAHEAAARSFADTIDEVTVTDG